MNIKDVDRALCLRKLSRGDDSLRLIFERQQELFEKYKGIEPGLKDLELPINLNTKEAWIIIRDFTFRVIEELTEMTGCLKNKPWKQTEIPTDIDHFREELSDAFHFFIELCVICGIDWKELFVLYMLKSEVNKFRQRSKY